MAIISDIVKFISTNLNRIQGEPFIRNAEFRPSDPPPLRVLYKSSMKARLKFLFSRYGREYLISLSFVGIALTGSALLYYRYRLNFHSDLGYMFAVSDVSFFVILGLSGLYFFAYRFYYNDRFYLLLTASWFANATYMFFEGFFDGTDNLLAFHLGVYLLSLVSTTAFFVATFIPSSGIPAYKKMLGQTFAWLAVTVGSFVSGFLLLGHYFPTMQINESFAIVAAGGIPFSTIALFRVAKSFRFRMDPSIHGKWAKILVLTFYLYGGIQPFYLLHLVTSLDLYIKALFTVALCLKVINGMAILNVLRTDFVILQETLRQRSVFEDIGAMAASIEHEIRNPLGVIETEISILTSRLQSNGSAVNSLNLIKEQVKRIFVASRIIPVLREDSDFFQRQMEAISVRDITNKSVSAVKDELNTLGIRFVIHCPKILYARAYKPLLQQVIVNILKNGVESIREAKQQDGLISISISEDFESGRFLTIHIQDNGCGIPEDDLSKVTGLMFSTKKATRPNSGMGLFISDRILRIHGGKLNIDSRVNEGTGVTIYILKWLKR